MVAAGTLRPARLVERVVTADNAGQALAEMASYNSLGFSVINDWTAKACIDVTGSHELSGCRL